jgi:hypothetical protein
MARRVIQELIDDISGQPADETVTFALDGVQYEIDLTAKNAAKLRTALAPFLAAATKVGRGGVTAHRRGPARNERQVNQAIREWAQAKGIAVAERGRIKQELVERYRAEGRRS